MHSNTILQSNLLDIIFENRNKEYGAYILRRDYNSRLLKSMFAMLGIVIMLAVLLSQQKGKPVFNLGSSSSIPDTLVVTSVKPIPPKKSTTIFKTTFSTKNNPPVIVKNITDDKKTPDEPVITGNTSGDIIGITPDENNNGITDEGSAVVTKPIDIVKPAANKILPRTVAEVMPQYPGGMKELIKFLKKNLVSPTDLGEGEEIGVKIKCVVTYDGMLLGFNIIQSGGDVFDNEVIRVLKKMPKWIPGKSEGENVSVYYVIPVKFNSAQ